MAEKKYIEIEADFGKDDLVSRRTLVTEQQIKDLTPILKVVRDCKGKIKEYTKILDTSQDDMLFSFLPMAEELKINKITSAKIITVAREEVLLEIN